MVDMVRIAVVGAGAWGINHVRAMSRIQGAELVMVCDSSEAAQDRAHALAPRARLAGDLADALSAADVDAVVLATPARDHAEQARTTLNAGKHVLVEKPLALCAADAHAVVAAAETNKRLLMVGHLMLFHPAVEKLKAMIDNGELGRIFYIYALRVNLGRVRQDENALWSLAPHDVSMIEYLLSDEPESVSARGGTYLQSRIEDVVFVNLRFRSGVSAQIQVSWLDPRKERRLTIVGSQKMVEFDDVHPVEKIRIYDKGVDRPPAFTEYAQFLSIRSGDIHIPQVPMVEPLERECLHFIECIRDGKRPLTDGYSALRVVRVLEAAQKSLESDGAPVAL
jgi:predicted dehydrogenase